MSKWLALAAEPEENEDSLPDTPTKADKSPPADAPCPEMQPERPFCQVLSGCRVEVSENRTSTACRSLACDPGTLGDQYARARRGQVDAHQHSPSRDAAHCQRMTGAGNVVSLEQWKRLSAGAVRAAVVTPVGEKSPGGAA